MTDAEYFDRTSYQETFSDVFDRLRAEGLFSKTRHEIENSDLFKLSPFKALAAARSSASQRRMTTFWP